MFLPKLDFIKELLSQGKNIEILQPAWFRQEVAKIIMQMGELYKN